MTLGKGEQIALNPGKKPEDLALSPEEFFVLTRIEGEPTVEQIIGLSGLGASETEKIIAHLVELGAVQVVASRRSRSRRMQTQARLKKLLRNQLEDARDTGGRERAREEREQKRREREEEEKKRKEAEEAEAAASAEPVVPPVALGDPRIEASLGIPVDRQRELLALEDRLGTLTHFEILGIHPTNDVKAVRKAFHAASRHLHPDAHYGKQIGRFHDLLDELFKRAKEAYRTLMEDEARAAYVEELLAPERRRQQAEAEAAALARAYAEEQERREREAAEARRQEEEEAHRAARKKRDEARKKKQRKAFARRGPKSPLEARKEKARGHHDEGRRLMEAGNLGAAANLFRLAKELDPSDESYHELWQRCFLESRRERASKAFDRARKAIEIGEYADAAQFFVDAAEANPTPLYLSFAADGIRTTDSAKARELALQCLDALNAASAMGQAPAGRDAAGIHLRIARAFHTAGQNSSARQQAEVARKYAPEDPDVLALLKSLKVT